MQIPAHFEKGWRRDHLNLLAYLVLYFKLPLPCLRIFVFLRFENSLSQTFLTTA